jgi:hypothetical protein
MNIALAWQLHGGKIQKNFLLSFYSFSSLNFFFFSFFAIMLALPFDGDFRKSKTLSCAWHIIWSPDLRLCVQLPADTLSQCHSLPFWRFSGNNKPEF